MNRTITILAAGAAALLLGFVLFTLHMTINRRYVPEGKSLRVTYKGPLLFGKRQPAKPGNFAQEGEIGVREELCGPGRHFYCPIWWKTELVDDKIVLPGEVAMVTSNLGEPLPSGEFLVDGDLSGPNRAKHKGILRKVFGPGRYRVNEYGFEFKIIKTQIDRDNQQAKYSGWVDIPTGYVGVVTNLASNRATNQTADIQDDVLPPGIYPINPREQHVDIIGVGFWETSKEVTQQLGPDGHPVLDESGEPVALLNSGIGFPSNDGFDIQLDFTAVWGITPDQAPDVVRTFGTLEAAEQKVIIPQSESICRINGSKMGAVELLVGETRQKFQMTTSSEFQEVLKDKHLTLLYGLVRHIYIPQKVRVPIQEGYIADELKLTREQETVTAKTEADLREAEKMVDLEAEKVRVETEKLVAEAIAEGQKSVKEMEAQTRSEVAAIDKQVASIEAKKTILLGEAKSKADQLQQEALSQKFQLAVEAFGSGDAYNKWQFAQDLPETIDLRLLYAGEGTLWTDLKNVTPTIPLKAEPAPTASAPASRPATQPASRTQTPAATNRSGR
jgi:hypothetical protein